MGLQTSLKKIIGGKYVVNVLDHFPETVSFSLFKSFTEVVKFSNVEDVFIRSTFPSRPNKVGLKCPSARPYVRPSVRPQKVTSISMTFDM